jgi:hypothetical protein
MAKFLDKKERVLDLELTSYGKHLLSIGKFKPVYYAFYDDNVIYDGAYANITESQNNVHQRIKNETPYVESLVLFEDVDNKLQKIPRVDETGLGIITIDTVPMESEKPRFDNFRYDNAIGDALLDGNDTSLAPSWKVVMLQSEISSSAQKETSTSVTELNIPQINITAQYKKMIRNVDELPIVPSTVQETQIQSSTFADNNIIELVMDDPIIYIDEVNTELLSDNFDIEVFLLESGTASESLTRKYFETKKQQVVDGLMVTANPEEVIDDEQLTKNAVEYYFNIRKDENTNQEVVCKQIEIYNKQSYYIDLDFDCDFENQENFFNDIYGSEVVPEICLD